MTTTTPPAPTVPAPRPRPKLTGRLDALVPHRWQPAATAGALWVGAVAADKTHPALALAAITVAGAGWLLIDSALRPGLRLRDRAARHAARLPYVGAAGAWTAGAAFVDWQAGGTAPLIASGILAAAACGWHGHRNGWARRRATPAGPLAIAATASDPHAEAVAIIEARWAALAALTGPLKGTTLDKVAPLPGAGVGSWHATINVADTGGDPERIEDGAGSVARAFRAPYDGVHITLDADNASLAHVIVLKTNTLREPIMWDGVGVRADGSATIGRHMSGVDMPYRFWDSTGAWNDLIAGATGSGKSELANLLLTMEIRSPLVDSYLIDIQAGQSFGEILRGLAGFASGLEAARDLAARIEAEMLDRNARLASATWVDKLGRTREGVKTWAPTADMPLISLTVDEAHSFLSDEVFRECIARICAMGRKCGIKVRLITQVPLLSSLGGKMEIRDAVSSGNVIVLRTANRLSGEVAASGNLPGKPHRLPRIFPGGATAAGLCYSAGAQAVPELGRIVYMGDAYDWLYDWDATRRVGTLLYPPSARSLPEAHVPPQLTAAQEADQVDSRGVTARDAVMIYMRTRPGDVVSRFEIVDNCPGRSVRGVAKALAQLLTEPYGALLTQPREGFYVLRERPVESEIASPL